MTHDNARFVVTMPVEESLFSGCGLAVRIFTGMRDLGLAHPHTNRSTMLLAKNLLLFAIHRTLRNG